MARTVAVLFFVAAAVLVGCGVAKSGADSDAYQVVDKAYVKERRAHATIVDVRTASEFAAGHIDGALHIDSASATADSFAKAGVAVDDELILYCRSGRRARGVAVMLADAGYTNIAVYVPGYPDWDE
jgi:rhodanese-related sulfurtransferase